MTDANVEAVRAVYKGWGKGDFSASLALLDPHVVLVHDRHLEASGPAFGIDAVSEYTRGMLDAWAEFSIEAEEIISSGDTVLVGVHQRGVGRGSGVPAELHYFVAWTFRGDKVVRFESIRDRAKALETVGLEEPADPQ